MPRRPGCGRRTRHAQRQRPHERAHEPLGGRRRRDRRTAARAGDKSGVIPRRRGRFRARRAYRLAPLYRQTHRRTRCRLRGAEAASAGTQHAIAAGVAGGGAVGRETTRRCATKTRQTRTPISITQAARCGVFAATAAQERQQGRPLRGGFTLVELIVVIAIVASLVGLFLLAVLAAREAARRIPCANHVRRFCLGALQLLDARGFLPSGRWGYRWLGSPNRPAGVEQPGGLIFNVSSSRRACTHWRGNERHRRLCSARPHERHPLSHPQPPEPPTGTVLPLWCMGSLRRQWADQGRAERLRRQRRRRAPGLRFRFPPAGPPSIQAAATFSWTATGEMGVVHQRSMITAADIVDWLAKTYLLSEKHIQPRKYLAKDEPGENESTYVGYDLDTIRWTKDSSPLPSAPVRDTPASPSTAVNSAMPMRMPATSRSAMARGGRSRMRSTRKSTDGREAVATACRWIPACRRTRSAG
jgi:prepilin-type N-terminal cleavage/methylation domain-containing protein